MNMWLRGYEAVGKLTGEWKGEDITICYEYSGYNLSAIERGWMFRGFGPSSREPRVLTYTMTTMPEMITPHFVTYLDQNSNPRISAVALSYDREKVSCDGWYIERVKLLKEKDIKVSCNFLLERDFHFPPPGVLEAIDQLNILSLKPSGYVSKTLRTFVSTAITSLQGVVPVAVDNCLGVQLGLVSKCMRGEDFVHLSAHGEVSDCCFKDDCYLYKGGEVV
jgi:hypothetical protein